MLRVLDGDSHKPDSGHPDGRRNPAGDAAPCSAFEHDSGFPRKRQETGGDCASPTVPAPDPSCDCARRTRACRLFEELLEKRLDRVGAKGLLGFAMDVLGPAVTVCDASNYIYVYARQLGYDIPPYPLAGCGEIKEFFADFGIASIPEFYKQVGIGEEAYAALPDKTAVAVRDESGRRKLLLVDMPFCRIERAIDMRRIREIDAQARAALPSVLSEAAALDLVERMLGFLVASGSDDTDSDPDSDLQVFGMPASGS